MFLFRRRGLSCFHRTFPKQQQSVALFGSMASSSSSSFSSSSPSICGSSKGSGANDEEEPHSSDPKGPVKSSFVPLVSLALFAAGGAASMFWLNRTDEQPSSSPSSHTTTTTSSPVMSSSLPSPAEGFTTAAQFVETNKSFWSLVSNVAFTPEYLASVCTSSFSFTRATSVATVGGAAKEESRTQPSKKTAPTAPPQFEVYREEGRLFRDEVPVMRILGVFPAVSPAEVCSYLVEPSKRLRWDKNYSMFSTVPFSELLLSTNSKQQQHSDRQKQTSSGGTSAPSTLVELLCPATGRNSRSDGIHKKKYMEPSASSSGSNSTLSAVQQAHDVCCHRVASPWMTRFGIRPRFFQYERLVVVEDPTATTTTQHRPSSNPVNRPITIAYGSFPVAAVSTLGSESDDANNAGSGKTKETLVGGWLRAACDWCAQARSHSPPGATTPSPPQKDEDVVQMYYQTIELVPILAAPPTGSSSPTTQAAVEELERLLTAARTTGSILHRNDNDGPFWRTQTTTTTSREDHTDHDNEKVVVGTMMVMTCVNDAKPPKGIPKFVERRMMQYFTSLAYNWMFDQMMLDLFP